MAARKREGEPPFQGLRVFLPRNYVPPEKYSALQDALTQQGAEVFPSLNASYNSSIDYHVLADNQNVKIKDLLSKGCRVVGPECVLRCAREHKRFPDRDYTCCLALEGVSLLLTGFSGPEKKDLEGLVTSMSGTLQQQTVPDIDFVIAKDVQSAKYKWAWSVVHKPVVTSAWLRRCALEHRQVPYDPYRMLALAGLSICATGVSFEERARIQEAAQKNGATYSSDLTKECSHLIAHLPEGRKYLAAKEWGLKLVSQTWFWESIREKLCLDEECFPVRAGVPPILNSTRRLNAATGSFRQEVIPLQDQAPASSPVSGNEVSASLQQEVESADIDSGRVQSTGSKDAMYLSGCRIFLIGFDAADMRRLVNLVRDGGGTRHIEMNETITHVILGSPPESEMKDIRQLAMWGAVYILQPSWLEECSLQKREVPTDRHQVPQNLLLQGKEQLGWAAQERSKSTTTPAMPDLQRTSLTESGQALKPSSSKQQGQTTQTAGILQPGRSAPDLEMCQNANAKLGAPKELPNNGLEAPDSSGQWVSLSKRLDLNGFNRGSEKATLPPNTKGTMKGLTSRDAEKPTQDSSVEELRTLKVAGTGPQATNIFKGHVFGFTDDYPADQRAYIIRRVSELGGLWEGNNLSAEYVLAPHGTLPVGVTGSSPKLVSRDWITQCVEAVVRHHGLSIFDQDVKFLLREGKLLDSESHILFRPLPCQIPPADLQGLKFCVSQYNERDRRLLRKLCHVLKVKFTEILNSGVTHLLCRAQAGEKYESSERLGFQPVTADWLYACITQNKALPVEDFRPRELTVAEQEAGKSFMTQCPTQAGHVPLLPSHAQTQKPSNHQFSSSQSMPMESKGTKTTRTKAAAGRRKASAIPRLSQLNAQATNFTVSSQGDGTTLDPWDANAPLVAEVGDSKMAVKLTQECTTPLRPVVPRPSPRPLTRSMKNGASPHKASSPPDKLQKSSPRLTQRSKSNGERIGQGMAEKSVELRSGPKDIASELDTSQEPDSGKTAGDFIGVSHVQAEEVITTGGACTNTLAQKDSQEGGICPPNVVDAIEGLLRQTSKVMGDSSMEVMEVNQDNQLISPEPTTLSRRTREETHTHTDFKKPKLFPTRSNKVEGDAKSPSPTPNQADFLRFDESQIDSQMVAYDEDHSERQRIMEKVRIRSSTIALSSTSGVVRKSDKSAAAWKGDQKLGRLFKAAEANK